MQCRSNQTVSDAQPQIQYARQKRIWNTSGVDARQYTDALAALTVWEEPLARPQAVEWAGSSAYWVPAGVRWNQMSDRAAPSGSATPRRGAAGQGVDVKHGSYDRYLLKLKGRAPLRRGAIPPHYGRPVPSSRAAPVRGGKVVKTAIIDRCTCSAAATGDALPPLAPMLDDMQLARALTAEDEPASAFRSGAAVQVRVNGTTQWGHLVNASSPDEWTVQLNSGYIIAVNRRHLALLDAACTGEASHLKAVRKQQCDIATTEIDKYLALVSAHAKAKALCSLLGNIPI